MSTMYFWGPSRPSYVRAARPSVTPALNVREDAEGYTLELVAPGLSAEAFELTFEDKVLSIRGSYPTPAEGQRYLWREQPSGAFARSLRFRQPVNAEAITARYEQGLLTVWVPKAPEAQPRKITVSAPALTDSAQ